VAGLDLRQSYWLAEVIGAAEMLLEVVLGVDRGLGVEEVGADLAGVLGSGGGRGSGRRVNVAAAGGDGVGVVAAVGEGRDRAAPLVVVVGGGEAGGGRDELLVLAALVVADGQAQRFVVGGVVGDGLGACGRLLVEGIAAY